MTQLLGEILGELGIAQYLDVFLDQGFDTWETILDITESDLDFLGVKLGHRRKLQRRIANSRGIAPDASLVSPTRTAAEEPKPQDAVKTECPVAETTTDVAAVVVTKRKYRRHPKPDENAPERPPSAYVLFSNKMREELKGRNLSFTEIAKLVGENWQNLTAAEKEPFESQAQAIKDRYLSDLSEYKKTPEYRKYMAYLQEFKAKHASPSQDKDASKRLRLSESQAQGRGSPNATPTRTSRSGSGAESVRESEPPSSRQRVGSIISSSDSQYTSSAAPSTSVTSPEEMVLSPGMSDAERQPREISPTFKPDARNPPLLPGPPQTSQGDDHGREQLSTHRHLPSLSDVFEGQRLPGGMRPSSEPKGYRLPGVAQVGSSGRPPRHMDGDRRPPLANGPPYSANSSSHSSFNHARPPVDGPLPIHALLTSKPELPYHSNPPSHPNHGDHYHVDQESRQPAHPMPDGSPGLSMINGYQHHHHHHHHHHSASPSHCHSMNGHHIDRSFRPPSQSGAPPPPPTGISEQGKQINLDGMSALLKAGELVDRRTQSPL